jgi:hypothetical protein
MHSYSTDDHKLQVTCVLETEHNEQQKYWALLGIYKYMLQAW